MIKITTTSYCNQYNYNQPQPSNANFSHWTNHR